MKRSQFALPALVLALLGLLTLTPAPAQTSKGILAGIVHDSTGAVIPGASVTITNIETHDTRNTVSQEDGRYRIDALQPGHYSVLATQSGFSKFQLENLNVNPSVVTSYDISFSVGGDNETVTIEANNTGINTENGQVAGVIATQQLQNLPVFTLNPVELALTVPGVQIVSENSSFSNFVNIQVNGARPRSNNFLLDGQEINDVGIGGQAFQPQIPDIFQSETVITNNASAEYGRAGGAVVNLVTKSGTNTFHGEVYERYTGSGLNSIDGQSRQQPGFTKARFDQHQYGFTAGGPIIKDKLFAFGGLFISRYYGKESASFVELPDAAGYATLQKIGGPQVALLNQYLSNGVYLTQDTTTGTVAHSINVGAQPNCNNCIVTTSRFTRPNTDLSSPDTQWTYRIDFTPRSADSFSFRYLHDRSNASPDFQNNGTALLGFDTEVGGPSELGAGTWTHIFGPNVVNELRASEDRLSALFSPTAATSANPLYAQPTINITNIAALGPNQNFPQGRSEELYQVQDTVSFTRGRQTLRVGFDIGRQIETDIVQLNAKGALGFVAGGTGTSALGNFLLNQLGPSGTATKTFGSTRVDPHGWRSGVFAQDDVKLGPDLTLNLGIRYDYLTNPENSLPYPAIDPYNPYLPINTVIKVNNDYNNIAPRIGFAYSPHKEGLFGNGKTVLRGGFGIFYDSPFSNFVTNSAAAAPNAVAGTLVSTVGNGLANATSQIANVSPNLLPTSSVTSLVNNSVNPQTFQYNLGVERSLPGNNLVAVRYIGTQGRKLYASAQFNYFAPGGTNTRLNTTRGIINARGNFASSTYNGAIVEFTHNFSRGLQISANYVFSKDLDNSSEIFATGANLNSTYTAANLGADGFHQEWGPSAYDHRHYVSVSYVWAPAGFHSDNAFANALLGAFTRKWTISGVEQFQSGSYSTIQAFGYDQNGDGSTANDRPLVGNPSAPFASAAIDGKFIQGVTGTYYDLPAYKNNGVLTPVSANQVRWLVPYQPFNQYRTSEIGRNSFQNPGSTVNNIAVQKGFGTAFLHLERGALIFRAEAQNLANHNDVGIYDTDLNDIGTSFLDKSYARRSSGNSGNRNLVLWAKFNF